MIVRILACLCVIVVAVVCDGNPLTTWVSTEKIPYDSFFWELSHRGIVKHTTPDLRARVDMNCTEVPLRDLLHSLGDQANITIFLDERKIANTQATFDHPMTVKSSDKITLYSALALALEQHGLAYYIKEGKVVVTNQSFVVSTESLKDRPVKE